MHNVTYNGNYNNKTLVFKLTLPTIVPLNYNNCGDKILVIIILIDKITSARYFIPDSRRGSIYFFV